MAFRFRQWLPEAADLVGTITILLSAGRPWWLPFGCCSRSVVYGRHLHFESF